GPARRPGETFRGGTDRRGRRQQPDPPRGGRPPPREAEPGAVRPLGLAAGGAAGAQRRLRPGVRVLGRPDRAALGRGAVGAGGGIPKAPGPGQPSARGGGTDAGRGAEAAPPTVTGDPAGGRAGRVEGPEAAAVAAQGGRASPVTAALIP